MRLDSVTDMNAIRRFVLVLALGFFTVGCGTIANHVDSPEPNGVESGQVYGGVGWDLYMIVKDPDTPAIWVWDLPLSMAGDTLLLPYDLYVCATK